MSSELLINHLKERLQYRMLSEQWLSVQILRRAAIDSGIHVPEHDVQEEGDRQRRELRLERSDQTLAWLDSEEITPDQWERGITDQLLRSVMAEHLFGKDVERIFIENRLNYDGRSLYRLEVSDKALVQELFYQIEDGEISFFEAAHEYDESEVRRDRCGFEGIVHRFELPNDQAEAVFDAVPHQVLAPMETESGFCLLWVDRIVPAMLTANVRTTILEEMLTQWLAAEMIRWKHDDRVSVAAA
jgi:hypothetical protein